jgi:peptide/nickel transport system permease protein
MSTVVKAAPLNADTSALSAPLALPDRRGQVGQGSGRRAGAFVVQIVTTTVPVFLIASFLTFSLGAASGSSPAASALGETATAEDIARLNHEFGLDQPFLLRYVSWLGNALTGDLGSSWFTHIPVAQSIAQRLPVSASIAAFALLLAVVVGGTAGILAALNRGRLLDRVITGVSSFLSTIPAFVAGIALIIVFGLLIPLFPTGGYVPPEAGVGRWLLCLVLPAVALSLDATADISRQLRTGLVGALQENYVTGALVRGLGRHRIVFEHALRNAAGPALAVIGLHLPRLIGGAVITEVVFAMPGLGQLASESALKGDVPVVQGSLLVAVGIVLVSSIVVNIALKRLQPGGRAAL